MKKVLFLALALAALLSGCGAKKAGESEQTEQATRALEVSPLLRAVSSEEGATVLLPCKKGVIALWEWEEGFTGSYVSDADSALTEGLVSGTVSPAEANLLETQTGKAILAADSAVWYILLDGSGTEEKALPEGIRFTGVLYGQNGLICEKDSLLVLVPPDLGTPLVLTDTASLPEYGRVLAASPDGKQIWYAKKDGTGLASFRPGGTQQEDEIALRFDRILPLSHGKVLLAVEGEGETTFVELSLETKNTRVLTVPGDVYDRIALSPDGTRIALWAKAWNELRLLDFSTGSVIGSKDTSDLGDVSALGYGGDGALYASFRKEGGEILGTVAY